MAEKDCVLCMLPDLRDDSSDFSVVDRLWIVNSDPGGGGGGVPPKKVGGGGGARFQKPLLYLRPYLWPIYDLAKNSIPYLCPVSDLHNN